MILSQRTQGLLYATGTALCWGVLAILLKHSLSFTDSKTIIAFRMIFAFLMLLPYLVLTQKNAFKVFKNFSFLALLAAVGLAYNYFGFMTGVAYTGASNAQIMIQSGPIILMLSGFLFFKENPTKLQIFFLLIAGIGFFLFYKDQATLIDAKKLIAGNFWILSGAITWVFYSIITKKLTKKEFSPQELNLFVYFICALILLTGVDFKGLPNLNFGNWIYLVFLGANTLIAYGCFGEALKRAPASQVSVIISMNPILTLLIIAFLGPYFDFIPKEPLNLTGYIGAFLVITGVICSIVFARKVSLTSD